MLLRPRPPSDWAVLDSRLPVSVSPSRVRALTATRRVRALTPSRVRACLQGLGRTLHLPDVRRHGDSNSPSPTRTFVGGLRLAFQVPTLRWLAIVWSPSRAGPGASEPLAVEPDTEMSPPLSFPVRARRARHLGSPRLSTGHLSQPEFMLRRRLPDSTVPRCSSEDRR